MAEFENDEAEKARFEDDEAKFEDDEAEFEDDEADGLITLPPPDKFIRIKKHIQSISINSEGVLCVVHSNSKLHSNSILSFYNKELSKIKDIEANQLSFYNKEHSKIKDIEAMQKPSLRISLLNATFNGAGDIVLVVLTCITETDGKESCKVQVKLLKNWQDNQLISEVRITVIDKKKKITVTDKLKQPNYCSLCTDPDDCQIMFYLSHTESSVLRSLDGGNTWTNLHLSPSLTNHWCISKSGRRIWATGNRSNNNSSVLTGYFSPHESDGYYEIERCVDEYNLCNNLLNNFKPYHVISDKSKNLIVVDNTNYAIHLFNERGDYLKQLYCKTDFYELRPHSVTLSHDEKKLYVHANNFILVLDYKNAII